MTMSKCQTSITGINMRNKLTKRKGRKIMAQSYEPGDILQETIYEIQDVLGDK